MTEASLIATIALAVPKDTANAQVIATGAMGLAVCKVGRMNGVSFNREWVPFTLTAGISSYKLGTDILQKYPNVFNLQELWFTDQQGYKITLVSLDEFNRQARGGTNSGRPTIGTIHSSTATLDVYPIPDAAYTAEGYIRKLIDQLAQIPSTYHDVIYDVAIEHITAAGNAEMASKLAGEGVTEVKQDSLTTWDGTIVESDRPIIGTSMGSSTRATAGNLTGV